MNNVSPASHLHVNISWFITYTESSKVKKTFFTLQTLGHFKFYLNS